MEITRIKELLKTVGLHNLAKPSFELEIANLNNLQYLEYLLYQEIRMRDEKNIIKRLKASNLSKKRLDTFDTKELKGITDWQLEKLSTMSFIDEDTNIIITGSQGLGKTHIANGIGNIAVSKGIKTYYLTLANLLLLINGQDKKQLKILDYIKECKLCIIDEFLYTPLTEEESQKIYHYLTDLNRTKCLILITNKRISDLYACFTDKLLGATLLDRLIEESQVINLSGESYRQKNINKLFDK